MTKEPDGSLVEEVAKIISGSETWTPFFSDALKEVYRVRAREIIRLVRAADLTKEDCM